MKFIKMFENSTNSKKFKKHHPSQMTRDELLGHILHLYGSIPLFKQKSQIVLKKILYNNFPIFGDDVDLEHKKLQDKVRFVDYFDSLLSAKEVRGHNFEGFVAGLYDGELSKPGEKYDLTIDGKTWSLKFVDHASKAPEIGSFQAGIKNAGGAELFAAVKAKEGLTKIFHRGDMALKETLWNIISSGITGGWLIAYPVKKENDFFIRMNIIDLDTMHMLLVDNGLSTAPKGGLKTLYSLALSAKYKSFKEVHKYKIILPIVSDEELRELYISDTDEMWAKKVFGKLAYRIRPDVLKHIKKHSKSIGGKLQKYTDFNTKKIS